MKRVLGLILLSLPALAYWAPNHEGMNLQVMREGRPWGAGFKRAGTDVLTSNDYVRNVLYVNSPKVMPEVGDPKKLKPGQEDQTPKMCKQGVDGSSLLWGVPFRPQGPGGVIGSDLPTDEPTKQFPVWCWAVMGGLWEDGFSGMSEGMKWGGRRAVNHFHDPLSTQGGGYTGLTTKDGDEDVPYKCLLRRGESVTKWVNNGHSGGDNGYNHWGYPTVGDGLHRAFTEPTLKRRESGLATAFRALGQMMHLIEDNTVPDHARDLAHPGNGFEEYVRDRGDASTLLNHTPQSSWVPFPVKVVASQGIRAFWDRDVYSGNASAVLGGVTPGLDEYVNANFLAWNRLDEVSGIQWPAGLHWDFTTVPSEVHKGFTRMGSGVRPIPFTNYVIPRTDNPVDYPWPQLNDQVGVAFASAPGSLSLPLIAEYDPTRDTNYISATAWGYYAPPLMARAHGYAESMVALALQPARAEVVHPTGTDPFKFAVQLWNLWPSSSPNALSWHLDKLELVVVTHDDLRKNPDVDLTPITIDDTSTVGPGQSITTTDVSASPAQRAAMLYATHTAVLVTAHLDNAEKTPITFAVPIPNGYPLVTQIDTVDVTSSFPSNKDCCPAAACAHCGENGVFRNALTQTVTGQIDLLATHKDIFQHDATSEVKAALERDTRIAAVELVAFSQKGTDFKTPLRPVNSQLIVSGGDLLQANRGLWVRSPSAPDKAPTVATFSASIDFTDFYTDTGDPVNDAMRASGSVFLAVWMTSGAVYYQRLILWPIGGPVDAQSRVMSTQCLFSPPRGHLSQERSSLCNSSATSTSPCQGTQTTQVLGFSMADSGLRGVVPSSPTLERQVMPFGHVRATEFAGVMLPTDDGLFPRACTQAQLAIYPDGNGTAVCMGLHGAVNWLSAQNRKDDPGLCGTIQQPPTVTRTAKYVRVFGAELSLFQMLGRDLPQSPAFTLTSVP